MEPDKQPQDQSSDSESSSDSSNEPQKPLEPERKKSTPIVPLIHLPEAQDEAKDVSSRDLLSLFLTLYRILILMTIIQYPKLSHRKMKKVS
jgi:hypothetical protein